MSVDYKNLGWDDRFEHRKAPWYGKVQSRGRRVYTGYHPTPALAAASVRAHRLAHRLQDFFTSTRSPR